LYCVDYSKKAPALQQESASAAAILCGNAGEALLFVGGDDIIKTKTP
jgi:hypothetical protein